MKFYDELSKVYDIVFRKDEETVGFLKSGLEDGARVLDVACGTGTYAIELAKAGHKVSGIDLDSEMIALANKKAQGLEASFIQGDMTKVKYIFEWESFNSVFCIGNSLVHLKDKQTIKEQITDMYNLLNKNGSMVLQIINYDRIINKNITSLPTIDRKEEGVKFVRNYRHIDNKSLVYFETELVISKDGEDEVYKNSVPLLAIQSEELIAMTREAGFKDIKTYGDFSGEIFDEDSYALVLKASK
jgi:ubiquinone/menaquinone biosynthesis C-methylase UbiE